MLNQNPYIDTQHFICEKKFQVGFVKYFYNKKILIIFVLGSKKCCKRVYTIFGKIFIGVSATKSLEKSRSFRYGSSEDFWVRESVKGFSVLIRLKLNCFSNINIEPLSLPPSDVNIKHPVRGERDAFFDNAKIIFIHICTVLILFVLKI